MQKWAPDQFSGEIVDWKDWSYKFASYVGQNYKGEMGKWMKHVEEHRETSLLISVVGEDCRQYATYLHGSLVATCQGKALIIVQQVGQNEGLEAWRKLLQKYEPRTKQSSVLKLCEILSFNFKGGNLLDCLESFDNKIEKYEKQSVTR